MHRVAPLQAAGYVGPFDGISFAALYGMKRFLTSYTGNLVRIRRSSDDAELDIGYDAATGLLDTAAIATFIGGGSGFITTWYDQSGNGRNLTQATAANQYGYNASLVNSQPGLQGTTDTYLTCTGLTVSLANPVFILAAQVATHVNNDGFLSVSTTAGQDWNQADGVGFVHITGPNITLISRAGGLQVNKSIVEDTWYVFTGQMATGTASVYLNGGTPTTDPYADTSAVDFNVIILGARWLAGASAPADNDYTAVAILDGVTAGQHNIIGNELATSHGLSWGTVS